MLFRSAELDALLQRLRQQAREAGKPAGRSLWRRYFLVRDAFASLGPAAVLTVHRSQGSTFGEVFIAGDVFWPSDATLRRQLVYVAVSRAMNELTLTYPSTVTRGGYGPTVFTSPSRFLSELDRDLYERAELEHDFGARDEIGRAHV